MSKPKFKVWRVSEGAKIPTQANPTDVGYDVYAPEDISVRPAEMVFISLGIIVEPEEGYHIEIVPRSSLFKKHGVILVNSVGVIDPTYSGSKDVLGAFLYRLSSTGGRWWGFLSEYGTDPIKKGTRILQLIPRKTEYVELEDMTGKPFNDKSRGGFGSTGK